MRFRATARSSAGACSYRNNLHLRPGSPAINVGTNVGVTSDFDGEPRPLGCGFDIGYDEATELPPCNLNASNDSPTAHGNATNFTATANGNNIVYQWNFGDGQTGSGATTSHTYSAAGSYTAIVTATNSLGSVSATTLVTIISSNNAPVTADDSYGLNEDQTLNVPAPGVLENDSDNDGDPLTAALVLAPLHGTLVFTPDGSFSYTPDADYCDTDSFTFRASDGTAASNEATISITIIPIDDAPTLDPIADMSLPQSAPAQTVNLSGISAGASDEAGQMLTITATSDNPALIANPTVTYSSPDATGTLSFTPVAGMSGSATIAVTVTEIGKFEGPPPSVIRTFVVFVGSVNNRPTLEQPGDLSILEDAGAQTVNLSGISAGPAGESEQQLTVTAASSNPALIANPTVTYSSPNAAGSLSFTPAANANGTVTITVTVTDDGGTAGGGIDFVARVFTVNVTPVNDAPDFTIGANQTVASTAGARTVAGWASGFTPGPADEAGQTVLAYQVVSNSNPALFAVAPALAASGTLTYTPRAGASGTATIGVVVRDSGGTANGGVDTSAVKTFTMAVGSGYRLYMPFMARVGAPDLAIANIDISPKKASYAAGEPVEITVVVENRGDVAAGPFWVDLSIDPDQPPTTVNRPWHQHCALKPCFGLVWGVVRLEPGARLTLTSKQLPVGYSIWPGWLAAGTTDMYAYVDSYNDGVALGAVAERDETNNQFHLGGLAVTGPNPPLTGLRSIADLSRRPARSR